MFGWFRRDPVADLKRRYADKMREAKEADKLGDRGLQADLYAQAQALLEQLEAAERARDGG